MDDKNIRSTLKDNLIKLNQHQLKVFYAMLVHYWAEYRYFISKQNFKNLWCELNYLCSLVDDRFPDPFNDHALLKSFCHAHPYYFIDILSTELIANLFCQYFDNRLDVLAMIANKLGTDDLWAVYESSNKALGLSENIAELVAQTEEHLKAFS